MVDPALADGYSEGMAMLGSNQLLNALNKEAMRLRALGRTDEAIALVKAAFNEPALAQRAGELHALLSRVTRPSAGESAGAEQAEGVNHFAIVDDEQLLYAIVPIRTMGEFDDFHSVWAKANEQRDGALAWQVLGADGLEEGEAQLQERGLKRVRAEHFHPGFRKP